MKEQCWELGVLIKKRRYLVANVYMLVIVPGTRCLIRIGDSSMCVGSSVFTCLQQAGQHVGSAVQLRYSPEQ